jgi:predicted TIM-barrel fold metal-dependent hydrolase
MIVDTHIHPIADDRNEYPRIKDRPESKGKDIRGVEHLGQPEWPAFAFDEMMKTFKENGVEKATLVQAFYTYQHDNSYVLDLAEAHKDKFVSVVVLDELNPETPDHLTDLVKNRRVRGWRIMGNKTAEFFADQRVLSVWKRAEQLNIPISLGSRYTEIPYLVEPIKRTTKVPICIEHTWSMKLEAPFRDYARRILDLAQFPNVHLKVAAPLSISIRDAGLNAKDVWGTLIEAFGVNRIMWGSNYPANWHKHGTFKERVALMKEDIAFLSKDEQDQILGKSAQSVWTDLK